MTKIILNNEYLTVAIADHGAALVSVRDQKSQERLGINLPASQARRASLLFPIVGQLKNNCYQFNNQTYSMPPLGFACDQQFTILYQTPQQTCLELQATSATLKMFPFHFCLRVVYTLFQHAVRVDYTVLNQDQMPLFFAIGAQVGLVCDYQHESNFLDWQSAQPLQQFRLNGRGFCDLSQPRNVSSTTWNLKDIKNISLYRALGLTTWQLGQKQQVQEALISNAPYWQIGAHYPQPDHVINFEPWWGMTETNKAALQWEQKFGFNCLQPQQHFNATWQIHFYEK